MSKHCHLTIRGGLVQIKDKLSKAKKTISSNCRHTLPLDLTYMVQCCNISNIILILHLAIHSAINWAVKLENTIFPDIFLPGFILYHFAINGFLRPFIWNWQGNLLSLNTLPCFPVDCVGILRHVGLYWEGIPVNIIAFIIEL